MPNTITKIDFNRPIDYSRRLLSTTFQNKEIIFSDFAPYNGPVTLQALPYGGIQSLFDYLIIIYTVNGFMAVSQLIYNNKVMSSKEFIKLYPDLINQVLPNQIY